MPKQAVVERPLEMAPRGWKHQIDQSIGRNVVKAVVELVLNADDSYRQLENQGRKVSGVIEIRLDRGRGRPSTLRLRDQAAGMSGRRLDKAVGRYGEATATRSARGFFGRGLKEAILGLGEGTIKTTCRGSSVECSLRWVGDQPRYGRYRETVVSKGTRGTEVAITVGREDADIPIPQTENLVESLERYFSLRDVMTNPNRKVVIRGARSARRDGEHVLSYTAPRGEVLEESNVKVPGYDASFTFRLVRADEPLCGPSEEGALAPGGILVSSTKGILALTLFKYSHDPNAERLYGRVQCEALDDLILKDEPVLKATRDVDGLIWTRPFTRALRGAVEERLRPHIEEEARRNKARAEVRADQQLRKRLAAAVKELNAIASGELGLGGVKPEPMIPEGGFGFLPEYVQVVAYKDAALYLRAVTPGLIPEGTEVRISSDTDHLEIETPSVSIERDPEHEGLGRARVLVKGKAVGEEAIVTARLAAGHTAEALVKVISKRKPAAPPPPPPPKDRGLFRDVQPDPDADPRQRAFVREHIIWIATQAPTVRPYIGPAFEGARDTPQGQIMMAELVAEAFCRELAVQRVQNPRGKFVFPAGGEADAREREFRRLHNQYAHRIHDLFVREEASKGRPKAAEMADRAAVPL